MLIPEAEALPLQSLITHTDHGIASRVLARSAGGNVTLFAFDAGQGLTEHTTAFDALALVLQGSIRFTVGGKAIMAEEGTVVRLPASVPHGVDAPEASRMLLIMLKDPKA